MDNIVRLEDEGTKRTTTTQVLNIIIQKVPERDHHSPESINSRRAMEGDIFYFGVRSGKRESEWSSR